MPHPDAMVAIDMLEYCRFIYKAYAQSCVDPLDPFFEAHGEGIWQGARDRLMAQIHEELGSGDSKKFDPIAYDLSQVPHPRRGVVYRGSTGTDPCIFFQPRALDKSIGLVMGEDLAGKEMKATVIGDGAGKRCVHFQGLTGMTKTHPGTGWRSWLGAAIYDADQKSMVIVFRGSRSGSGGRALGQALVKSEGNPDWVTDMNHLKDVKVPQLGDSTMAAGFWFAYASCKASLAAAFYDALNHGKLEKIFFTGHSLGGALAQCAYVDMMGGTLLHTGAVRKLIEACEVHCYAMSAPPICLGTGSAKTVDKAVGGAKIYHYFAPKDSVHDSPEVAFSGSSLASGAISAFTHPRTKPVHIGVEIPLKGCKASFPDAHEPTEVLVGLIALAKQEKRMGILFDETFWPLIEVHTLRLSPPVVSGVPVGLEDDAVLALSFSVSKAATLLRSAAWSGVAKGKEKGGFSSLDFHDGEATELFEEAIELLGLLSNPFGVEDPIGKSTRVLAIRKTLLEHYRGASKHKASSACIWALLQHLTARSYGLVKA